MQNENASSEQNCSKHNSIKDYSHLQEAIDNLPYLLMMTLGAWIFIEGMQRSTWGWIIAAGYFSYGIVGAFWIIVFVCPYCNFYGTRLCPCGYGQISAKIVPRGNEECFTEKFRTHIPVIVPLWFLPLLGGGYLIWRDFSWVLLLLLLAFCLNSFVVLPLVSRAYGCAHCSQKETCPWMKKKVQRV